MVLLCSDAPAVESTHKSRATLLWPSSIWNQQRDGRGVAGKCAGRRGVLQPELRAGKFNSESEMRGRVERSK
jgi:hypothetical protein